MVEKRQHPLVAMLWNQLMYAVVSFMIVTSMPGLWQQLFGLFFFMLYLSGVYGYAKKAGSSHQKSYSNIKPHIKFPTAYALVTLLYFLVPILVAYLFRNGIVWLIVVFWESPFFFGHIIYQGVISWLSTAIFGGILLVTPYLGYLAGIKQFSLTAKIIGLLYRPAENDKTKK